MAEDLRPRPLVWCEGIMPGMAAVWREQNEHWRDHREPDPDCWFCTHPVEEA